MTMTAGVEERPTGDQPRPRRTRTSRSRQRRRRRLWLGSAGVVVALVASLLVAETPVGKPGPPSLGGSTPTASTSHRNDGSQDLPPGRWKLRLDAQFKGNTLDSRMWSTCYDWNCTNNGSLELEWYTSSNVSVSNGEAHLTAKASPSHGKPYTSGMIQSDKHFIFRYGYMEIRARLPRGRGLWPAFWSLPANHSWPPEIDVFEAHGGSPNTIEMTVHEVNGAVSETTFVGPDFTAGFHNFGVDWEPHHITWYIDGVPRKTVAVSISQPQYLLVNLAVNSHYAPDGSTRFPASLVVKYVTVWQHPTGPSLVINSGR